MSTTVDLKHEPAAATYVESAQVAMRPTTFDEAAEARVVRKLDFHFLSLVTILYFLAYLDRSNIGNAKVAGMVTDMKFTDGEYRWLLTMFYISYVAFEWFALMWKKVPPHRWAAFCVLGFGLASTLQGATTNWSSFMAARFFLGLFEAGYGPGIPYLLSFFYLRNELGLRCGIYASAAAFATCFAGALAYGLTQANTSLASWRLLFIVEGLPTVVMAPIVWYFLPDSPATAKFLSEEEKVVVQARGVRQVGEEDGAHRIGKIEWKEIFVALSDFKNWVTALMYCCEAVCFASLPVFLPQVLKEMGFSYINAQGLSAPPYFIAGCLAIGTTIYSDRLQQRAIPIIACSLMAAVGYVMIATTSSVGSRYAGVYLAAAGVFPAIANTLPWVLNNQGTDTKRGTGIALLNVIGQCGPLIGMNIFPAKDGPYYRTGMGICAGFMFLNGVLAFVLRAFLAHQNKKLDQLYGPVRIQTSTPAMPGDDFELMSKSGPAQALEADGPAFRYVL